MGNEVKEYTIKLKCNGAFYRALVLMLRYCSKLGMWGSSRQCTIYFDGDGADTLRILSVSHPVEESSKGIKETGDFLLDTDEVWGEV